jgi:hypothetical protein
MVGVEFVFVPQPIRSPLCRLHMLISMPKGRPSGLNPAGIRIAGGSARGQGSHSGRVVVEIVLAVFLLSGASLAIRGFIDLPRTDPGIQPENTLTMRVNLQPDQYPTLGHRYVFRPGSAPDTSSLPGFQDVAIGNGGML